ncbi:DNA mismatch repair endonuclease MutL [Tengunoibacter tsumagoiensis]|uniref:DNA mismatch repair protein MutL n=1 Tax=Tengunoibacter tsumagoiensis TaxID=2014871 RepID=A0A402A2M0_9CHLR|nr:DNA mismatch repair endonuclease MutL [Tengunoibacter tsumagoiensis]GCE13374.1 DNA mismatch repair protein MutL [Tengunoibacter tsumagoiensis]
MKADQPIDLPWEQPFERAQLQTLPLEVAERIAAGEVIERPASVVKELLENALDAGAHELRIEIRGGGLRMIRVTDDGYGIPEHELEAVCQRHTTSKIRTFEDLSALHTFGFRGEALASIATIAEITILSRTVEAEQQDDEQAAFWITLRGNEMIQRGRRARLHGTTITVRDLFYNVPARLSFMRGARTENSHILQLVRKYAAGYPATRFTLILDEHLALQTSGSGSVVEALTELYHLSLKELLSPIELSDGAHYRLYGYLGNRILAQHNRQYLTLFVNGRLVNSRGLQEALEQGYRSLLPKGKHPLLVLHIEVPPPELDANIHPAKAEVQLVYEKEITRVLTQAVQSVLEHNPVAPEALHFPGPVLASQRRLPGVRRRGLHVAETAEGYRAESAPPGTAEVIASLHPLAQLQQAVILAEASDGSLYLIDQHRAHERVIYEHLRSTSTGNRNKEEVSDAHLLLEPVMIEMKRYEADLLEQRLPLLRGLGIECERFGGRSFLIRSVPVGHEQAVEHLQELATLAAEDSTDWEDQLLIGLACRSALRRGRELSSGEQRTLLHALAKAAVPAVCPHGSPILLHYSRSFLIEKFSW